MAQGDSHSRRRAFAACGIDIRAGGNPAHVLRGGQDGAGAGRAAHRRDTGYAGGRAGKGAGPQDSGEAASGRRSREPHRFQGRDYNDCRCQYRRRHRGYGNSPYGQPDVRQIHLFRQLLYRGMHTGGKDRYQRLCAQELYRRVYTVQQAEKDRGGYNARRLPCGKQLAGYRQKELCFLPGYALRP